MKKCKIIKKYWWILLLILATPVGLNFLLGIEVKCKVIGEAKDWLGFWVAYVAIIVSTAMVILTYKSLQQNKKNFIDQEKRYNDQANRHNLEISLARAQKSYEDLCEKGKKLNQFGLYQKISELITEFQNNNDIEKIIDDFQKIHDDFTYLYQDFDSMVGLYNMFTEKNNIKDFYNAVDENINIIWGLINARNKIGIHIKENKEEMIKDCLIFYLDGKSIKDRILTLGNKKGYKIDEINQMIDEEISCYKTNVLIRESLLEEGVRKVMNDSCEELKKCREQLGVRF